MKQLLPLLLIIGCTSLPDIVPIDFSVEYRSVKPTDIGDIETTITLDSDIDITIELVSENVTEKSFSAAVSKQERQDVYSTVKKNDFFDLKKEYKGKKEGSTTIMVTANNKKRTVRSVGKDVFELQEIESALFELANAKEPRGY